MVFSSVIFLFFFLPIVLLVYYLLKPKARNIFLLISSLIFYYWGENYLVWIVITSTFIDYICGLIISGGYKKGEVQYVDPNKPKTKSQKIGLMISILSNLGFLIYFKYANFFVDTLNSLAQTAGLADSPLITISYIALPLGISFYSFQSMSYSIDVYMGQVKATRNFLDFACYVTLFPQLVAGPIVRYRDIETQLNDHDVNFDHFTKGVFRFVLGLAKKVIIANTVAQVADAVFALPANSLGIGTAWIGIIAYTLQIYFDFSGYSDMAIGLGHMFGFTFLENFNYPYISRSIQEFWRRWHISLSTWWRDYLYIPLGGSKGSTFRTYFNLLVVFFLCGLWHGASWSFVFWGLYQGFFLIIERLGLLKFLKKLPVYLQHTYVLIVTVVGWVFFRADNLTYAVDYLKVMFGITQGQKAFLYPPSVFLNEYNIFIMILGIILSAPVYIVFVARYNEWTERKYGQIIPLKVVLLNTLGYSYIVFLLVISALSISSGTYNPFIYFRF